jgi:hypothetical protein
VSGKKEKILSDLIYIENYKKMNQYQLPIINRYNEYNDKKLFSKNTSSIANDETLIRQYTEVEKLVLKSNKKGISKEKKTIMIKDNKNKMTNEKLLTIFNEENKHGITKENNKYFQLIKIVCQE